MKKLICLLSVIALLLGLPGCGSLEVRTCKAIEISSVTVTTAMEVWKEYCDRVEGTQQRVTLAQHKDVERVYEGYWKALDATESAVYAYKAGQGGDLKKMAEELEAAVNKVLAEIANAKKAGAQ